MVLPLRAGSIDSVQFASYQWFARIPNDTQVEDIIKPAFWVHHAQTLKPGQRVELVTEDYLLDVELRVTKVADGLVFVNPLRVTENVEARKHFAVERVKAAEAKAVDDATEMPADVARDYKIGFSPGSNRYFVTLKASKTTIKTGCATKAEAIAWAIDHSKKALAA